VILGWVGVMVWGVGLAGRHWLACVENEPPPSSMVGLAGRGLGGARVVASGGALGAPGKVRL